MFLLVLHRIETNLLIVWIHQLVNPRLKKRSIILVNLVNSWVQYTLPDWWHHIHHLVSSKASLLRLLLLL